MVRALRNSIASGLARWQKLSVAKQFTVAAIVVIGSGMIILGEWVSYQIRLGVLKHTAAVSTLYMGSFVEPLAQELASRKHLSEPTNQALRSLSALGVLKDQLVAIKIWTPEGRIEFSTFPEIVGKTFPVEGALKSAFQGEITTEVGETTAPENEVERQLGIELLEVYSPLYGLGTGKVIAVGEFYLRADNLMRDVKAQTIQSRAIVGAICLLMAGLLSGVMLRASRMIDRQQLSLKKQVNDLSVLLDENKKLNHGIELANVRAADINDQFLMHIGADLHDGPAQLLGLALMQLDEPAERKQAGDPGEKQRSPQTSKIIRGALTEIRNIASGLMLPELKDLSLFESLELAISSHERLTGTRVQRSLVTPFSDAPKTIKNCIYRLTQESLNNAFRHAAGSGQKVVAFEQNNEIVVEISDTGPGFAWNGELSSGEHLGLRGLQSRIQTLRGSFKVETAPGRGTRIIARIPMPEGVYSE